MKFNFSTRRPVLAHRETKVLVKFNSLESLRFSFKNFIYTSCLSSHRTFSLTAQFYILNCKSDNLCIFSASSLYSFQMDLTSPVSDWINSSLTHTAAAREKWNFDANWQHDARRIKISRIQTLENVEFLIESLSPFLRVVHKKSWKWNENETSIIMTSAPTYNVIVLLLLLTVELSAAAHSDLYKTARLGTRIVQTRYGRLQGLVLGMDNYKFLKPVEAFLAVPYATPPVKSNRWVDKKRFLTIVLECSNSSTRMIQLLRKKKKKYVCDSIKSNFYNFQYLACALDFLSRVFTSQLYWHNLAEEMLYIRSKRVVLVPLAIYRKKTLSSE